MSDSESFLTRKLIATLLVVCAATLAYALWGVSRVPAGELVPTHWNAAGEIDDWGSRWMLLMGPGMQLFMLVLMPVIARVEPRRQHMAMSFGPLRTVLVALSALFAGITVLTVRAALGEEVDAGRWMVIGMGAMFIVLGNLMGKIRSTFTFGIRTPWTLSSEVSWVKTHRLTGIIWTALGLIVVVLGLVGIAGTIMLWIFMSGVLGSVVFAFVYSYVIWKVDPNRKESP